MKIETALQIVGALITAVGAYVVFARYLDEKKKANQTAELDARRPYSTKQQEVYFSLLNVAAILSNRFGQAEWDVAQRDFWVMFWGAVPLVADEGVSQAVDRFAELLDHPEDGVPLRNASMDLARACRKSLGVSWRAKFAIYEKSPLAGSR